MLSLQDVSCLDVRVHQIRHQTYYHQGPPLSPLDVFFLLCIGMA